MKIINDYATGSLAWRMNKNPGAYPYYKNDVIKYQTSGPKGIVLHSVGCPQPDARKWASSWKNKADGIMVHGFISATEDVVVRTMPDEYRCCHVGSGSNGSGNTLYMGFEMGEPDCIKYVSGASFNCTDLSRARVQTKTAYDNAVELFAQLCIEHDFDPLDDNVILSHREAHEKGLGTNHGDPVHLWNQLKTGMTMDGFRKDVESKVNEMLEAKIREILEQIENERNSRGVSSWAASAWLDSTERGVVDGTKPRGYVTREMLMQILANEKR